MTHYGDLGVLSLCIYLFSNILPHKFQLPQPSRTPVFVFLTQSDHCAQSCSPSSHCSLESASRIIVGITLCLFFQGVESCMTCAKSEAIFYKLFSYSLQEGMYVPIYLSCSEAEEYTNVFYYKINFINRNRTIQIFYLFSC